MPYDNALTLVKQVIKANRYTITISCGKLTTGVTVPEWTAVMMLTGSASTAASGYMQTIFRVQSAGVLDGKQKECCYVFDFAPDRALNVISEVNRITKRGRTNEEQNRAALGEFLNFCPVIAVDGTQMTAYSVSKMMRQIKRLTVDKAIKSGFDDESVYKQDTGIVMDEDDVELFHTLSDKLSEQKAAKKETKVHINHQGLTGEEYEKADKISNKPKRERTKEDDDLLKKLQEQKKEREKVIRLLRNVSIRLPLLIYGAKVDLTESIKMADFITLVDEESWQEFMPKTVDKPLFRKLLKYYDEDVVSGAGLRIRRMAKAADELPPTERVKRIAEIFSHFRNPDKETVLTPWRVVNLHLSNMVGGYCFLNEQFDSQEVLEEPRLVDQGEVTEGIRPVSPVYGIQPVRHEAARPGGQAAAGADTGSLAGDRGAADFCSVQDPDGRKHHPADAGGLSGLDGQHHLHSAPAGTDGKRPAASGKEAAANRYMGKGGTAHEI